MHDVHWPVARVVAFVLFVIAAVIAAFVETANPLTILAIISSGLAAWVLA